ncbi:MAG: hypothetical protein MZU91_07065 [Desulfosudis oleivorans]|nr:hypothetical protein [Desulfosudis oleivorans]
MTIDYSTADVGQLTNGTPQAGQFGSKRHLKRRRHAGRRPGETGGDPRRCRRGQRGNRRHRHVFQFHQRLRGRRHRRPDRRRHRVQ